MIQGSELPFLSSWQNFYLLLGTAAATLAGLMFVVTALLAGHDRHEETLNAGISAFNTPTVVHFCAVLLIAGILSASWDLVTYFAVVRSHAETKSRNSDVEVREFGETDHPKNKAGK